MSIFDPPTGETWTCEHCGTLCKDTGWGSHTLEACRAALKAEVERLRRVEAAARALVRRHRGCTCDGHGLCGFCEAACDAREAMGEVERLTRERDEARSLAERNEAFARDAIATAHRVTDKWAKAEGESARLRRVAEAARELLGWKLEACYEHLTPNEQGLRRALVALVEVP